MELEDYTGTLSSILAARKEYIPVIDLLWASALVRKCAPQSTVAEGAHKGQRTWKVLNDMALASQDFEKEAAAYENAMASSFADTGAAPGNTTELMEMIQSSVSNVQDGSYYDSIEDELRAEFELSPQDVDDIAEVMSNYAETYNIDNTELSDTEFDNVFSSTVDAFCDIVEGTGIELASASDMGTLETGLDKLLSEVESFAEDEGE